MASKNDEQRNQYVKNVKKALNDALNEVEKEKKISINELTLKLMETYGFSLNKDTLSALLNPESTAMDSVHLISLCRYLGFDFNKILSPKPLDGKKEEYRMSALPEYRLYDYQNLSSGADGACADIRFVESMNKVKKHFLVLNDDGYVGEYIIYTSTVKESNEKLIKMTLKLYRDKDGVFESCLTMKRGDKEIVYHGVPVFVKKCSAIIMFLINDKNDGDFVQMSFSYKKYDDGNGLLYRQGFFMTGDKSQGPSLRIQSFILIKNGVPEKNEKYIFGLLKAPNHYFNISVSEAEMLAKEDPTVDRFLTEFEELLRRYKNEGYLINEDEILFDRASKMSEEDIVKALLLLKQQSKLAYAYHCRAEYRYTDFGVNHISENGDKK